MIIISGPCTYEEIQDTIGAADINYTEEDINSVTLILRQQEVGCKRLCDVKGEDCWAVAVVAGSRRCRTYQTSLPFLFDDKSKVMSERGSTLFIKRCYTGEPLDNTEMKNFIELIIVEQLHYLSRNDLDILLSENGTRYMTFKIEAPGDHYLFIQIVASVQTVVAGSI